MVNVSCLTCEVPSIGVNWYPSLVTTIVTHWLLGLGSDRVGKTLPARPSVPVYSLPRLLLLHTQPLLDSAYFRLIVIWYEK
jgi:hypothetical protein